MRRTKAVITAVAVGVLTFATACASSASTPVSVPPDSFASTTESAATAETANDAIYLSTDSIPEPTPHAPLSKQQLHQSLLLHRRLNRQKHQHRSLQILRLHSRPAYGVMWCLPRMALPTGQSHAAA